MTAFTNLLPFLEKDVFLFELLDRPRISGEALYMLIEDLSELRVLFGFATLAGSLFYRMTVSRLLIRSKSLFSLSLASTSTTCFGSLLVVGI